MSENFLQRLVGIQRQLDRLAGFPAEDQINQCLIALNAESHEALAELKPIWCWWKQAYVDRAKLQEELIDCWFFYLSLLDKLDKNIPPFELAAHTDTVTKEMLPHIRQQTNTILTPYKEALFHLNAVNAYSIPLGEFDLHKLMLLTGALITASLLVGLDTVEIEKQYKAKARVNMERWGKTDHPLYEELA